MKKALITFTLLLLLSNSSYAKTHNIIKKSLHTSSNQPISYLVYSQNGKILDSKNIEKIWPIASITKLMTATVFTENNLNSNCLSTITTDDIDEYKHTSSRLPKERPIRCEDLMWMMLIASDNTAASAISKSLYGISQAQFINLMNKKASELGMNNTHFVDSSGLSPLNVSTAFDLTKLVAYLVSRPKITQATVYPYIKFHKNEDETLILKNTNRLVRDLGYHPLLSKTGHISEAGYNLVYVQQAGCSEAIVIIILGSNSAIERTNFANNKIENFCK